MPLKTQHTISDRWPLSPEPASYRLAILQSHPIQYFAPLFRRLAREPDIDLTVFYCSRQGIEEYVDRDFGTSLKWDIPLVDGYSHKFLCNRRGVREVGGFFSLINPSVVRELHRGQFDALWVHGHNYATILLATFTAKLLRIPVLMRCETHLLLRSSPIKRMVRYLVLRFFYRYVCSRCLPIGTRNREFYRFHEVGEDRLFMVPYTVDNQLFIEANGQFRQNQDTARRQLGLPPDKPVVLFASKLTPRKRPMDLLVAYQKLRALQQEAALVFVGSGSQEETLRRFIQENSIPDVYFLGFRNQSELPLIYAAADIFVLPSENEPWGLIINEVMCAGLPVVAAEEIGAVPDLVRDGFNGLLFPAGDVDQLALSLSTLTADPALRKQMGEHSRSLIETWDFERCLEGIRQALRSLGRPGSTTERE